MIIEVWKIYSTFCCRNSFVTKNPLMSKTSLNILNTSLYHICISTQQFVKGTKVHLVYLVAKYKQSFRAACRLSYTLLVVLSKHSKKTNPQTRYIARNLEIIITSDQTLFTAEWYCDNPFQENNPKFCNNYNRS